MVHPYPTSSHQVPRPARRTSIYNARREKLGKRFEKRSHPRLTTTPRGSLPGLHRSGNEDPPPSGCAASTALSSPPMPCMYALVGYPPRKESSYYTNAGTSAEGPRALEEEGTHARVDEEIVMKEGILFQVRAHQIGVARTARDHRGGCEHLRNVRSQRRRMRLAPLGFGARHQCPVLFSGAARLMLSDYSHLLVLLGATHFARR